MGMKVDGKAGSFLKSLNQFRCLIGSQKTCHILNAEGIRTHLLDLAGNVLPVLKGIGIPKSIA